MTTMDLSTFCETTHSIKNQFSEGKLSRESAISKLATLYTDFFGLFTGSYQEAALSDFYIDEEQEEFIHDERKLYCNAQK